jgi:preprotein translocase subunit Sec61beta
MSKNDKISMPSSQGGLIRYFDEEKTRFVIKPGIVVAIAIAVIAVIILFRVMFPPAGG